MSGSSSRTDRYLARIAARLRMPAGPGDAILDELASHIHEAIAELGLEGRSPDQAEREALDRLGSPDALGDDLRRTHQTTRRLLAAAGGGVWYGLKGGARGYLGGLIVSIPLFLGTFFILELLPGANAFGVASFSPLAMCSVWGAAWLGGRYLVESVSAGSLRDVGQVRVPIAVIGACVIVVLVAVVPMDQTVLSMAMTLATPFVFVAGALTTDRDPGGRLLDALWPTRLPSVRRVLFVAFATLVLAASLGQLVVALVSPRSLGGLSSTPPVDPSSPGDVRWSVAGYDVVAPNVIAPDRIHLGSGFEDDGFLVVDVPTDVVDWDEWSHIRFEAWEANPWVNSDHTPVVIGAAPYLTVPIDDPWSLEPYAVRVGQPGIEGFLIFIIAQDPRTDERVAIGWPDGGGTQFHGSALEWFGLR